MTQWVRASATELDDIRPTWWEKRTNSGELFPYLYTHTHTHYINLNVIIYYYFRLRAENIASGRVLDSHKQGPRFNPQNHKKKKKT